MNLPSLPPGFDSETEFPILKKWIFLNHAAVTPLCARAGAAIRRYVEQSEHDSYLTGKWYKQAELVRRSAAKIINAEPAEVAFVKNTSEGLAFVANGLSWKAGDEIISTGVEFPANVFPWMDLQKRLGVRHIMLPEESDARVSLEKLLNSVTPRTRMIALSHVEYASGFRNDLKTIGEFCRARDILFCVDAIQSIGALPVDVKNMKIDFLSADGHKWMLGPEGLGIFYCRRELITGLRPEIGWMNVINATDYGNYDFTLRSDAKRFECGAYNLPGVLGLGAALDLLLEIGGETVWKRIDGLTGQLADGLARKGYILISPRDQEAERSGILSFVSRVHNHDNIIKDLEDRHMVLALREGRLRASPHFYNTPEQMNALLEALPAH